MGDPLREINSRHNYFVPGARGGVKGKKEGEFLFVVLVEIEGIFREIKVTLDCSWCISMMIGRFYDKKKSTGHLKKTCETFPCFCSFLPITVTCHEVSSNVKQSRA